jgi:hypothetical protein
MKQRRLVRTILYKEMNNQLKLQSNLPLLQPVLRALSSVIVLGLGDQFIENLFKMFTYTVMILVKLFQNAMGICSAISLILSTGALTFFDPCHI